MTRENSAPTKFAIHIYDDVEPIDVGATFGVLSMAKRIAPGIEMFTVAERAGRVRAANALTVIADHDYRSCPAADVLVLTGGPGWVAEAANAATLDFIRRRAADVTIASVCTGGMILAATGLLDGRPATTKRAAFASETIPLDLMRTRHPQVEALEARLVDSGNVVTGGGVTLAIDVMLHLIERFYGKGVAEETARVIEYQRAWQANKDGFAAFVETEDAACA